MVMPSRDLAVDGRCPLPRRGLEKSLTTLSVCLARQVSLESLIRQDSQPQLPPPPVQSLESLPGQVLAAGHAVAGVP